MALQTGKTSSTAASKSVVVTLPQMIRGWPVYISDE